MAGTGTPECKDSNPTKSKREGSQGRAFRCSAHLPEESRCSVVRRHGQVWGGANARANSFPPPLDLLIINKDG